MRLGCESQAEKVATEFGFKLFGVKQATVLLFVASFDLCSPAPSGIQLKIRLHFVIRTERRPSMRNTISRNDGFIVESNSAVDATGPHTRVSYSEASSVIPLSHIHQQPIPKNRRASGTRTLNFDGLMVFKMVRTNLRGWYHQNTFGIAWPS